jgi:hypothetical protein
MEQPKTITTLLLDEATLMAKMPKEGKIWINNQAMQPGGMLRLGREEIKRGEGVYQTYVGDQLTYAPPQSAFGVIYLEVSWGYVGE